MSVFTLNEVINYFVEKTEYRLFPYLSSQAYDTYIGETKINNKTNKQNDQTTKQCLDSPTNLTPPTPTEPVGDEHMIADVQCPEDEEADRGEYYCDAWCLPVEVYTRVWNLNHWQFDIFDWNQSWCIRSYLKL